jgi:hypothetical protein
MSPRSLPLWQRLLDVFLWGLLSILAGGLLVIHLGAVLLLGDSFEPGGFAIGMVFWLLAMAGVVFRWGPMIPFMLGGMIAALMLTAPISSSPMEVVIKSIGQPIVGGIVGAAVGYLWDVSRRRQP